ncbi:DeoR/GlpR family DNA-binding transcription regulator [Georgenia thermotolerans]|uniref:DeoR family transcriptional regulator n=1 Tax=Georgenia thermotolerans TaxID=527326 RepID=A0A7J5UR00_9MICO|nr:DeoR/GlpR family DNA-binding transcription regulator [Georgenia thermotolerans]KAE8764641.1 DeoR family transcriptional regulator [Georgenia thermotolerans]
MAPPQDTTTPLLARQRQDYILARVTEHGGVRVAEVVEALGVSEMTVRRDITELVARGLVDRVHGGAVAAAGAAHEPLFQTKAGQRTGEKERIGALAAARVRPGDSVALTAGSTTLAVARALAALPHLATLTVITNSLPAAQVLQEAAEQARGEGRPAPTIILTGGERTRSDALVGPIAVDALRTLRVEWAFLGAHGFDPEIGLMTPNLAEAATNAAMVAAARTPVAVLDAAKWGVLGLRTFCPVEQLAVLVTDAEPDAATRAAAERHGIVVEVADEAAGAGTVTAGASPAGTEGGQR